MHRLSSREGYAHVWFSAIGLLAVFRRGRILHRAAHGVRDRISARLLRLHGSAELTLYGDGCDAVSEHLIRAALPRAAAVFSRCC
ncbi:MAG: hypothetical protein ACLR4Z_02425 [Butyricicoccaceae bacterium]